MGPGRAGRGRVAAGTGSAVAPRGSADLMPVRTNAQRPGATWTGVPVRVRLVSLRQPGLHNDLRDDLVGRVRLLGGVREAVGSAYRHGARRLDADTDLAA